MYEYRAKVTHVVDGDTVDVAIDLGLDVWTHQRLRLYGINSAELRGAERTDGQAAKHHLESLLEQYAPITVSTIKDTRGKYGRYLAVLWGVTPGGLIDLNRRMIDDGHAQPYEP